MEVGALHRCSLIERSCRCRWSYFGTVRRVAERIDSVMTVVPELSQEFADLP